ncbi:hypothetical protein [Orenia marismortui]|uniref:Uncharacterized protein n=1 Tax=Orenia marismortui TaxID=46469 RepID=A0A4R8H539_9FIRM|nr:hypothetical protein [Orenia marismortui]TDX52165.1 hypothetical protein C7959_10887 [Orenia marismortui]
MGSEACVEWIAQNSFVRVGWDWVVDSEEDLSCTIYYCPFCGSELNGYGCTKYKEAEK